MKTGYLAIAPLLLAACGASGGTTPHAHDPGAGKTIPIAAIQGAGPASPLLGQRVRTQGIVTGDFQDNDADPNSNLGGFFVQQVEPDVDNATSDGVFVYDGATPKVDVSVGDLVDVEGKVVEYFGETQVRASSVRRIGTGVVQATPVALPAASIADNEDGESIADLERYEGMLVRFDQELTITDLRDLGQFGAVTLASGGRLFQYTNGSRPDVAGYAAHRDDTARRVIVLDDGRRNRNPSSLRLLRTVDGSDRGLRTGDTIAGLTGVLRYSRGSGENGKATWRLEPTIDPDFDSRNPRPGAPAPGGTLSIAAANALNFFSTIDDGSRRCGPRGGQFCRGANSAEELSRQRAKTSAFLAALDADIVGLMELENNARTSLEMIVGDLNARLGGDDYAFIDTGTIHDDAIKTGFIYRRSAVTPVGSFALLDRSVDARFNDARNRPALAQAFRTNDTGAVLSVVVNHLKSKGSSCEGDGDPNLRDGQGECNITRSNAAAAIADWIASDPTGSGDPDVLVIGDMNAFAMEDPIETFQSKGLVKLLAASNTYSYVFDGQAGALDHAFATSSLAAQVVSTEAWHVNADESPVLDYNLDFGRDPALFDPDSPYRASDHDPIIIGIDPTN